MEALDRYQQTVKISQFIERNLDALARVVEGLENRNAQYNILTADLKKLFPGENEEELARALITEKCRSEFIKMKDAQRPRSVGGRD